MGALAIAGIIFPESNLPAQYDNYSAEKLQRRDLFNRAVP
jgi:hypothetical protein